MPVHPYYLSLLDRLAQVNPGRLPAGVDATVDARMAAVWQDSPAWPLPDVDVRRTEVVGPHGPIPIRVYRPRGAIYGSFLWVHGGGFAEGTLDMPEAHHVSAELAVLAVAVVVSVDYRLAGDAVRYPVPIDDVVAAWDWMAACGPAPRSIGGASAGAALAVAATMRIRDRDRDRGPLPDALVLVYPFLHHPNPALDVETALEMAAMPPELAFPPNVVEAMVRAYVGRIHDLPPDALPGSGPLVGLPPTRIVRCQYDGLRPSAELFARQLADAGVPVSTHLAEGMLHGHLSAGPEVREVRETLELMADAISGRHSGGTTEGKGWP